MKYYKHNITGQIMASVDSLRDLIIDGKTVVITDVILPNTWLGSGIISHSMSYADIRKNYKRITKKIAFELYPDFGQWRHIDDIDNKSVSFHGQYHLNELKPKRKYGFGQAFTEHGKKLREEFLNSLSPELREDFLNNTDKKSELIGIYWGD